MPRRSRRKIGERPGEAPSQPSARPQAADPGRFPQFRDIAAPSGRRSLTSRQINRRTTLRPGGGRVRGQSDTPVLSFTSSPIARCGWWRTMLSETRVAGSARHLVVQPQPPRFLTRPGVAKALSGPVELPSTTGRTSRNAHREGAICVENGTTAEAGSVCASTSPSLTGTARADEEVHRGGDHHVYYSARRRRGSFYLDA